MNVISGMKPNDLLCTVILAGLDLIIYNKQSIEGIR